MWNFIGWLLTFATGLFLVYGGIKSAIIARAFTGSFIGNSKHDRIIIIGALLGGIALLVWTLSDAPFTVVPK